MKQELALILFAAASVMAGCSSAPLTPGQEGASTAAPSAAGTATPTTPSVVSDYVDYPAGPYGTVLGATIENLEFLGWKHPDLAGYDVSQFEKVRLSDFYNPDGRNSLKLLAVNASAVWCSVCRSEYEDMHTNGTYATYNKEGVEILGTLFQDATYYPAQPLDLTHWGQISDHAVTFPLVLDPGFKMGAYFGSDATPLNMVVDVRTMTIVLVTMGYSTAYWTSVQSLLDKL